MGGGGGRSELSRFLKMVGVFLGHSLIIIKVEGFFPKICNLKNSVYYPRSYSTSKYVLKNHFFQSGFFYNLIRHLLVVHKSYPLPLAVL